MKIGAQLYSVRTKCETEDGIRQTLEKMKEIGYQSVQVSGFAYDAEKIKSYADMCGMHIGLTHTPIKEIIENTDEVIKKHKIMGADMVGIGAPVGYLENNVILYEKLISDISPAVKKIKESGLRFGYHNHHYEFMPIGDSCAMDIFFARTDWDFILDTGWVAKAGKNPVEYIKKLASRLKYVHLKDFYKNPDGTWGGITYLYNGGVPVTDVVNALENAGCEIAYVEQDNAVDFEPYEEMAKSYANLKANGCIR